MATRKNVPASEVRAFLLANPVDGETVGTRGKFSEAQIERFRKANKGKTFEHAAHKPTRKVTTVRVTDSGRKVPVNAQVSLPDARKAAQEAGYPLGSRGRIPEPVLKAFVAGTLTELVASL